jgi:hypothetical protein
MAITRPGQLLWFVGAAVFVLALFHTINGGSEKAWMSKIPKISIADGYRRTILKESMDLSEKIWAKTVRQRHEMKKDWEDEANIPL